MTKSDKFWMVFLLGLIVLGLLTSCKTKYVSVPEYHTEYVYHSDTLLQRDSIFERDSIYVIKSGDTIATYHERILYRDRWRDKIVYRDSIKVDSVRVPYPVERELTFWQKTWMNVGKLGFIGLIGLAVVTFVVILVRRFLKRYKYE